MSGIVEDVAAHVRAFRRTRPGVSTSLDRLRRQERPAGIPLSVAQEGIWLADQTTDVGSAYNIPWTVRLDGRLDRDALARSLAALLRRHESLRTRIALHDGAPVQIVEPAGEAAVETVDLRGRSAADRAAAARAAARDFVKRPFDLGRGPLLRAILVQLDEHAHDLTVCVHHIAADGWSMALLARDLAACYGAYSSGREPPLPGPALQYADFAIWQRGRMAGPQTAAALAAACERLAGAARLDLPTDRPRPRQASYRGGVCSIRLSTGTSRSLRELGRTEGVTLFMVLLAAFKLVLGRYAGHDNIVVGSPVAGRPGRIADDIVGLFAYPVVLRTTLSGAGDVRGLLRRVRDTVLDAFADANVPFERLAAELGEERDASCHPVFQVSFAMLDMPVEPPLFGQLRIHRVEGDETSSKFDLSLFAIDAPDGIRFSLEYATELFDRASAERCLHHVGNVLSQMAGGPGRRLTDIGLVDEAAFEWLVSGCNATERACPAETLPQMVGAQARLHPDATAVRFGTEQLSYAQLWRRSGRLARALLGYGIGVDDRVAVCLPLAAGVLPLLLATARAGSAYVPLEPGLPPNRLAMLLQRARPKVVVLASALPCALPEGTVSLLLADLEAASLPRQAAQDPALGQSLAYVIFTSGSTGVPKAVMVEHDAVSNYLAWAGAAYGGGRRDAAVLTSLSFDATVTSLWLPLATGGCVSLLPDDEPFDDAARRLQACPGFDLLKVTPAHLDLLAQTLPPEFLAKIAGCLVIGGEPLHARQLYPWLSPGGSPASATRLFNEYGPTEATVGCCVHEVRADDPDDEAVAIGRPIANTRLYGLDRSLAPVPAGLPGELFIAGAGLARGYLGQPGVTAGLFLPDPFGRPGSRMYRTGDLVRRRTDGTLDFAGRVDSQVKLRGFRIELGEVQAALSGHASVARAIVTVREDRPGNRRLVAYAAATAGAVLDPQALRRWLEEWLPSYMVPAAIVPVQAWPLTSHGKINQAALPAPERQAAMTRAPRTPQEAVLCQVFAQTLRLGEAGADDDFFELGGDSMGAIALAGRAHRAGLRLTARDVFRLRSPAALAAAAASAAPSPETAGEPTGELPATPIMSWLMDHAGPIDRFFLSATVALPPRIAAETIEWAVQALLDRHDLLRGRLAGDAGAGWRLAVPLAGTVLAADCLQQVHLPEGATPAQTQATADAALSAAADRLAPRLGRMVQAVWLREGCENSRLCLVVHHLVADAVSWHILAADLERALADACTGRRRALDRRGTSFRTWSRRLADTLAQRQPELPHWAGVFTAPHCHLTVAPVDPLRDTVGSSRTIWQEVPSGLARVLLDVVPPMFHAGVQDVLLAALALAVAGSRADGCGTTAIVVDLEGHGRQEFDGLDLSATVGWFTTLAPVRVDAGIRGDQAPEMLAAAVKRVKEQVRAMPDGGIGYGLLRYADAPCRDVLAALPRPAIRFNYLGRIGRQGGPQPHIVLGGGRAAAMPMANAIELDIAAEERPDGPVLVTSWRWAPRLLPEPEMAAIASLWLDALAAVASVGRHPSLGGLTPSDLALSPAEPPVVSQPQIERLEAAYPGVTDILPVSAVQAGLLFHALYDQTAAGAYQVQLAFDLEGPLDAGALRRAAKALIQRHEWLRSAFDHVAAGRPLQLVLASVPLPWRTLTLDAGQAGADALAAVAQAEFAQPFNPARPPLLRFVLARRSADAHTLLMTYHHLALDGWSTAIVMEELFALYRARCDAAVLPAATRYRHYAAWLAARDREQAVQAWQHALAGLDGPTRLAPPSMRGTVTPSVLSRTLPAPEVRALIDLARRCGVTLGTVWQLAWGMLVAAYTLRSDVVFGIAAATRPPDVAGSDRLVGLFLDTLPVRLRLREAEPVAALLARIQSEQADLAEHRHLGLAAIQQAGELFDQSDEHFDQSGELFDTLLVIENFPVSPETLPSGPLRVTLAGTRGGDASHYPLGLTVLPGERVELRLSYRPDLFDAAAVEGMADFLTNLLATLPAMPHSPLGRVPLLSRLQWEALRDWNTTGRALPCNHVPGLFEAQVDRTPDAIALVHGRQSLSFRLADKAANRLAHHLIGLGVGPEDVVALRLSRGPLLPLAMLAVLKAGAAYLPLDPGDDSGRHRQAMRDSGAVLTLTDVPSPDSSDATRTIRLDEEPAKAAIARASAARPGERDRRGPLDATSPAYIIYTSGSTGGPKGVTGLHGGAVNRLAWFAETVAPGCDGPMLAKSPISFIDGSTEILGPLVSGLTVVLAGPEAARSIEALRDLIEHHGVAAITLVPSLLEPLMSGSRARLGSCRTWIVSGEKLRDRHLALAAACIPSARIINLYGSSEVSGDSTAWFARGHDTAIGTPVWNTSAWVLDWAMRPTPPGAPGQFAVGGLGLARGYLGWPGLTAARFVPDPLGLPGARCFRTGDRACYRQDGALVYLGRTDLQVKLRGFRVEPGEVEAALLRQPGVAEAAVVAHDGSGATRLVAYLVPASGVDLSPTGVLGGLSKALPAFLVPAFAVMLPVMPRTSSGKLDRRSLPAPPMVQAEGIPPRTALEASLCRVMGEVLGTGVDRPVGIGDSFTGLGGDSIGAMRLASLVAVELGIELPIRLIFEAATVADLAERLEQQPSKPAIALRRRTR